MCALWIPTGANLDAYRQNGNKYLGALTTAAINQRSPGDSLREFRHYRLQLPTMIPGTL